MREIRKNPEKAEMDFCEMFPTLKNPQKIFAEYASYWKLDISPDQYDSQNAYAIWKSVYPSLMENFQ
jgi:hypothetical protein